MKFKATIANTLWSLSNLPSYVRFCRSLRSPGFVQQKKLRTLVERNVNTAFGKAHHFDQIRSYEEFVRRVPLSDYSALKPWITRVRQGESNVLTQERITHLVPTSGSTSARKLIPFAAGLQQEFNMSIGPWLVDLARRFPSLIGGPAY